MNIQEIKNIIVQYENLRKTALAKLSELESNRIKLSTQIEYCQKEHNAKRDELRQMLIEARYISEEEELPEDLSVMLNDFATKIEEAMKAMQSILGAL